MSVWANHREYSPVVSAAVSNGAIVGMATAGKVNLSTVRSSFNFSASDPNAGAGLQAGRQEVNKVKEFAADARQTMAGMIAEAKDAAQVNDGPATPQAGGGKGLGMIGGAVLTAGATFVAGPLVGAAVGLATTINDIMQGPPTHAGTMSFSVPGQGGKSEFSSPISRSGKGSKEDGVYVCAADGSSWDWTGNPAPQPRQQKPAAAPSLTPTQLAARELLERDGIEKMEERMAGVFTFERDADNLEAAMNNYTKVNGFDKDVLAANDPKWKMTANAGMSPA